MTASAQPAPGSPAPVTGYPPARRLDLVENLHGHEVADPYRWLEDAASQPAREWLSAQDGLWAAQAAVLPAREPLAARISQLLAAGYRGTPVWRGSRQFFMRRLAGQEHGVLLAAGPGEPERVLIDPVTLDPSGLTTLDAWQPDKEGRLLAYQVSAAGDEESVLHVIDVATGAAVDGPITRCRYSPIAWLPGGAAFYYVRKLAPGQVPPGEEQFHRRVYLHVVGAPEAEDALIFGAGRDKTTYYGASVSRDGRWLVVSAAEGTAPRNDLWLADLAAAAPEAPALQPVQEGVDAQTSLRPGRDGRLYVFTDAGAPRGRLAVTDPARPGQPHWRDLLPEDPVAILTDYAILDGPELGRPVLLASWTRHTISEITVHDLETGARTGQLALPGSGAAGGGARLGSTGGISERPEGGHEAWFSYTDATTPLTVYHYDARAAAVTVWAEAPGAVAIPEITTRQVTFASKDGTEIRMLVLSPASPGGRPPGTPRESAGSEGARLAAGPASPDRYPGGRPPGTPRESAGSEGARLAAGPASPDRYPGGRPPGTPRESAGSEGARLAAGPASPDRYPGGRPPGTPRESAGSEGARLAAGPASPDRYPGGRPPGTPRESAGSPVRRPRPAILYGYGGFGISMAPAYSASALAWVEAGGVYAIAALRGGGEEGEAWHRAGLREHKQNVFDDFHAAAQALIDGGWTTREQLGISGGSNGGLLVGAAITQRPDLYAAAVCSAPLLDMVRYERFGLGQTWNDEYGTAADPAELGWLLGYSPYHHVRDGVRYPATLFTVFGNDTRVDPVHARKMCAALQHATAARWPDRPVLLRREGEVGHGARAVSRAVALSTDSLAFLAFHTGLSR